MKLDIVTLMAASSFVAALAALVLGAAWISMRERALAWWATASTTTAVGVAMLANGLASLDQALIATGAAATDTSAVLVWAGTRTFCGRRAPLPLLVAAIAFVPLAGAVPLAGSPELSARLAGFSLWIAFLLAATWELWRGRGEPLPARWALMTLFLLHAAVFAGGVVDTFAGSLNGIGIPLAIASWFGVIHFESLIYSMGATVFMVLICKERSERVLRDAARTDSLTGAASRGAFMAQADQLLARCRRGALPLTLVLFDLDRFKAVNDTYGHKTGDEVLRVFADSARRILRPTMSSAGTAARNSPLSFPPRRSRPAAPLPSGSASPSPRRAGISTTRYR